MNARLYDPVLGRMISPDNFVNGAFASQAYNRYSYAQNNPLKYTDPSGNHPVLAGMLIGALSYAIPALLTGQKWDWAKFGQSITLGGIGGVFGMYAPIGALNGAAYGAVTGGVVGGIGAEMNGGNFWNGALSGGITGGILGGISGGLGALDKKADFWTGYRESHAEITLPSELGDFKDINGWNINPSEKSLKEFSDNKFGSARSLYKVKYKVAGVGNTPDGYSFDVKRMLMRNIENGDFVNAIQDPSIWGGSTIWMSPARFSNDRLLFKTLGHELIHAWHSTISFPIFTGTNYTDLTESVAHDWSMTIGMKFGFDVHDFQSSITQFNKFYGGLNANGLSLYENTYHWYNNSIFSKYKWTQY